jgi:hypothetical protein
LPGGTGTIQSALVGEWSLILINQDPGGMLVSSSETRWRFDQDGVVTRTSIATSFVSGIQDVVRATGRWSATPSMVTIELTNPPSPALALPWRIEGTTSGPALFLGTLRFLRRP